MNNLTNRFYLTSEGTFGKFTKIEKVENKIIFYAIEGKKKIHFNDETGIEEKSAILEPVTYSIIEEGIDNFLDSKIYLFPENTKL